MILKVFGFFFFCLFVCFKFVYLCACVLSDPRLKRGFSSITENEVLVNAARTSVLHDIQEDNHAHMFMTFMLPDLSIHPEPFRAFLMKELIESSTLHSLESAGMLMMC